MHTDTPLPRKEGSNLVSEGEERKKGKKRGPKGMKSVRDYSQVGDVETFCGCTYGKLNAQVTSLSIILHHELCFFFFSTLKK